MPQCIAIIDDERSVRSGLSNLLQSEGYATEAFDSAEVFLSHPTALTDVGLVIADIRLRGMNGIEMLEKLHLISSVPPPVIYISGHADDNMQRYAIQLGAVAFLPKPIHVDVLLAHISRALET